MNKIKIWNPKEIKYLKDNSAKFSLDDLALKMNRTRDSIEKKIMRLSLPHYIYPKAEIKEESKIVIDELTNNFANLIKKDYQLKRYPEVLINPKGKQEEIANLVISDLHGGMDNIFYNNATGKNEITYNDEIRKKEEINYIKSVRHIYSLLSYTYYFKELKIYLLGDMITNDRIFEGQSFEISKGYGEQIWEVVFELADMINLLSAMFPKITVFCCVGNHGRSSQSLKSALNEPVTNNFEYTLYRILKLMLEKNKKIEVIVPESRFYSTTNYEHKIFMSHGDTIRGFSSGYLERKAKELLINLPEGYNLYVLGHRHVAERKSISPTAEVLVNGCLTKETPILMSDFSIKQIKEIKPREEVIGFIPSKRGYNLVKTKVLAVSERIANVYEMKFNDGRILNITKEHPIYAYEKKVHLFKKFIWKFPYENIYTFPIGRKINLNKLDWEIGYLAGFLDGDGCVYIKNRDNSIKFYNNDKLIIEWIKNKINDIFKKEVIHTISKDGNTYFIQLNQREYIYKLLRLIEKTNIKLDFKRGYLAGIYDAEGNFRKNTCRMFNTDKNIVNKIILYCKELGLYNSVNWKTDRRKDYYKPLAEIIIYPSYLFFLYCQPKMSRKKNFKQLNPISTIAYRQNNFIEKISFKFIGKQKVYNIETDVNTYIANGVPVHNSWINHDNYAFDIYGSSTKAIQYFFGSSRKRIISWLFGLDFLDIK